MLASATSDSVLRENLPVIQDGRVYAVAAVWRDAGPIITQLDDGRTHVVIITLAAAIVSALLLTFVFRTAQQRLTRQTSHCGIVAVARRGYGPGIGRMTIWNESALGRGLADACYGHAWRLELRRRWSVRITRQVVVVALALTSSACGSAPTLLPPPAASNSAITVEPSPTVAPSPSASPATSAAPAVASGAVFAFPYPAGTVVTPGSKGLHDDNFSYLDDRAAASPVGTGYTLAGAGLPTANPPGVGDASLDLVVSKPGIPVIPLAAGTVLASSAYCQTVLVDHGSGSWVEYVHIVPAVAAGQSVTRAIGLGTVAPPLGTGVIGPCGLQSDAPHVHFAFLTGSGTSGTYVSLAGRVLCSHAVTAAGGIDGLSTGPGDAFTVPTCPGDGAVPPPTAISATWVAPKAGAKLTTSALTLSAKAALTPTTSTIAKVAFNINWGAVKRPACSVVTPDAQGQWACAVDLWGLGAVPGPVTFTFDVTLAGGQTIRSPAGTRKVTLAAAAELMPSSGACTGLVAGIDPHYRYHAVGDCNGKIQYWMAGQDGRWSLTKFAAPARGVEYGPIIAFSADAVYVFYTLVADNGVGCGPGLPPIAHPGVYYRKRTLPNGPWSEPVQVGKDNDILTAGRGSGATFYLAIYDSGGNPYLERLSGSAATRIKVPGYVDVLRVGSDGALRFMYTLASGLRYGTLTGSSVSSQPVPGTDTFDGPTGLVLGPGDSPYAVFVRNHVGGGCASPGPDPSDGVYVAIRTSGTWHVKRISTEVGPAAITVAKDSGRAYILVAGSSLRLFRGGTSSWSSAVVSSRQVGSPILLLDRAAGGLLVGYAWSGSASGSGAGLYFQISAP